MPPPVISSPPGYVSEDVHGESQGSQMIVAIGTTLSLATIIFLLRIVVKKYIVHSVGWEDYFAGSAVLLAIGRTSLIILLIKDHQYGQHVWDFHSSNFNPIYTYTKGSSMTYLAAMACARISVLLLYTRLFGIKRAFRYTCYTLMTLVVGYSLALILVEIFQCRPISAGWNFFAPGHCASLPIVTIANGGLNILSDFAVVVAPIPLVSRLQLRRANMIGLLAIFSTGLFTVVVAIIRVILVVTSLHKLDQTWSQAEADMWLSVELHTGITCASLPFLSPLGKKIPSKDCFKSQYRVLVSLFRKHRSKTQGGESTSHIVPPGHEFGDYVGDYIELEEPAKTRHELESL